MIAHFFATRPEFLPAFFFGILTAFGAGLWKSAKGSCLLVPIYLYIFGAWCLMMVGFIFSNPTSTQAGFALGFLLPSFGRLKDSLSSLFDRIQDSRREQHYRRESEKWEQENQQRRQWEQSQQQERARAEQARREQEARQYREQQERARREQEQQRQRSQNQQRRETPKDPPPKPPPQNPPRDTRTPEQILGLPTVWTQEDLKTAYRRESQRLHPDKWAGKPEAIQKAMEAEFKAVQQAYNRLKK